MRRELMVVRSDSPLGRWIRHAWKPSAGDLLCGVVREIVHWTGEAAIPRERLLPGPTVELVVHVGTPHRIVQGDRSSALPAACISGIATGPVTLEAPPGESTVLCIRLHPAGARSVLGRPLDELVDRTVDLRDCIGPSSRILVDALEGSATAEERLARAIAWILARWRACGVADQAVAWVASEIERTAGAVPVTRLQERTGLSRSRLSVAFRREVGVSAKRYARLVRFRRALALLHGGGADSLSRAALESGYYDQSHMTAEFREFAGITPGAFLAAVRPPEWIGMAEPAP